MNPPAASNPWRAPHRRRQLRELGEALQRVGGDRGGGDARGPACARPRVAQELQALGLLAEGAGDNLDAERAA